MEEPNDGFKWDKKTIAAALVIMFGANSTGFVNAIIPGWRADSFTLTDFQDEKLLIIQTIQAFANKDELEMDKMRDRLTRLEEGRKECERRIKNCENK